jgi:hypothetical protein
MAQPALERASPSGAVAGNYVPIDNQAVSVAMDDGIWAELDAIGWVRDIRGGRAGNPASGDQTLRTQAVT